MLVLSGLLVGWPVEGTFPTHFSHFTFSNFDAMRCGAKDASAVPPLFALQSLPAGSVIPASLV